jgi:hypothetical protein
MLLIRNTTNHLFIHKGIHLSCLHYFLSHTAFFLHQSIAALIKKNQEERRKRPEGKTVGSGCIVMLNSINRRALWGSASRLKDKKVTYIFRKYLFRYFVTISYKTQSLPAILYHFLSCTNLQNLKNCLSQQHWGRGSGVGVMLNFDN